MKAELVDRHEGRHRLRTASLTTLAAACGLFGWGYGINSIAAFVVPIWFLSQSRLHAWLAMFVYFLAASRTIPFSSAVFFEEGSSPVLGVFLWVGSAAILAAPWAIFRPAASSARRIAHLVVAIIVSVVPPVGLIGWTNPILGAALVVPGGGWVSLGIGFALLAACAWVDRRHPLRSLAAPATVVLLASITHLHTELAPPPKHWVGATMHAGHAPTGAIQQAERQLAVIAAIDDGLAKNARVIVLPEQILGTWSATWHLFLEASIGAQLREHKAQVLLGAAVPISSSERTFNSAIVYDGTSWRQANARFAIPVSMWKPWSAQSTVVEWFADGTYWIDGRKILLSLCYEDLLVWPALLSFIHKPQLIVSMANAWWAGAGPKILDIQREHIEAWARIFNVPIVRAVNAP